MRHFLNFTVADQKSRESKVVICSFGMLPLIGVAVTPKGEEAPKAPKKPKGIVKKKLSGSPESESDSSDIEQIGGLEPVTPGSPGSDSSEIEQIGGLEPVTKLSVRFPHMLCRRFHDDRVAAAIVCFSKRWDSWISDSQLMAPEEEMAIRANEKFEVPMTERTIAVNRWDEWTKYVFGMVMFADPADLVDVAFPGATFREREDTARMFERNLVAKVIEGGRRCEFSALLSSGVDFPARGFESDLSRRLGVEDLTEHMKDRLCAVNSNSVKPRREIHTLCEQC